MGAGRPPGTYKQGDYVVGVDKVGLPAGEVSEDVGGLARQVREPVASPQGARNALTVASFFHA